MAGFFDDLRKQLFGKTEKGKPTLRRSTKKRSSKNDAEPPASAADQGSSSRAPFFVQIGFDFGTAFSKCVCRDIYLEKAWIHRPPNRDGSEFPFLISSAVSFDGSNLSHPKTTTGAYENQGLYHVKMALEKIGAGSWGDPVLAAYKLASGSADSGALAKFVETCAIFLIGGALGQVKRDVLRRFPGKVEGDFLAVNMAVPVADANHPGINDLFDRVLRRAWVLADKLAGHPVTSVAKLDALIRKCESETETAEVREACFIYPEVSANVQGFVRSRTSREGIYLFSDTGAGTVDQSVFLFARPDDRDHLTYLYASVLPLGSSCLERIAAKRAKDESWENLEKWRQRKEAGENRGRIGTARKQVGGQLAQGTSETVRLAKEKLKNRLQMNRLRVIFGGGGHCENPYRSAVIQQFDGSYFRRDEIEERRRKRDSFDLGMPVPRDLELGRKEDRWMHRLTVAYGLSFERGQLATFTLPKEVGIPPEEEIWKPVRRRHHAPSKDEV